MLSATCWAFEAPEAQGPVERLTLILLAEGADEFGLVLVDVPRLAGRALCAPDAMKRTLAELERRGILRSIPGGVAAFAAATGIDVMPERHRVVLLAAWPERERLALGSAHPVFGMLQLQ